MEEYYKSWIGKKVVKKSGKPFKSKSKEATVTGITINGYIGKLGFTFAEDDSVVECRRCSLVV